MTTDSEETATEFILEEISLSREPDDSPEDSCDVCQYCVLVRRWLIEQQQYTRNEGDCNNIAERAVGANGSN